MDFKHENNRIFLEDQDGKTIAEVTFPNIAENKVNVSRTFVDKSLRGQGVADKLLNELVKHLKNTNQKATATCSYAVDWFEKHPEHSDIIG